LPYYFYVLRSKKDGDLYKGVAEDVERRLAQHNAGKTRSLKHRTPLVLVHVEEYATREEALAREQWSKTPAGGKELRKLVATIGLSGASAVGSPARAGRPVSG